MLSLAEALAALTGTADDIAAHLTTLGRLGIPGDGCNCPITNYLTGLGFDRVYVGESAICAAAGPGAPRVCVVTPARIAEFVVRFDAFEWLDLVLDDAAEATDV